MNKHLNDFYRLVRTAIRTVAAVTLFQAGIFPARADDNAAFEIGEAMLEEPFWKSDPVLFVKKHQAHGFKFTTQTREAADSRRDGAVTCFGLPVYETRLAFSDGGIARVEVMLYATAGTEGLEDVSLGQGVRMQRVKRVTSEKAMTREEFFTILHTVRDSVTPEGSKPPAPEKTKTKSSEKRHLSQTWKRVGAAGAAKLTWNYTQVGKKTDTFKAGFIRFDVEGPAAAGTKKGGGSPAKAGTYTGKPARDELRGDVFVDGVPMVDQGQKGYCAVAASERVLRFYGVNVDEHEIAEAAGTTAERGTTSEGMKNAVAAIGKRYKLAVMTLYGDFDKGVEKRIANLDKEVANYNKTAKKMRKKTITEDAYVTHHGNMVSYNPAALDEAMDPEVLREMKVNGPQKSKYTKFRKDIHQYIAAGMPLLWGVTLGIFPEEDIPQAKGGHIRLIIGYNDKKDEILYSDTWGRGHELKRMPASWAWTISHCLLVMKPLK